MHAARPPQTIYDSGDQVTWLADADLAANPQFRFGLSINADGSMDYATAQTWVSDLNTYHGRGYLDHNDWTLPVTPTPSQDRHCSAKNRKGGGRFGYGCIQAPLAWLYKHILRLRWPNSAVTIGDGRTGPFHDFQPYLYWTDHPSPNSPGLQTFSFNTGFPGSNVAKHYMYMLPMLPGNPFGATASSGLEPVDGGQAVWEPDIGVTWLADADLSRSQTFKVTPINADGSMQEPTAAGWLKRLNKAKWQGQAGWLGQTGWDFPTQADLQALYNGLSLSSNQPVVPVPYTIRHGFQDLQPYLYWSCAGPGIQGPCQGQPNRFPQQWSFSFGNGYMGTDLDINQLYVMVYYPRVPPNHRPPIGRCPPSQPGHPVTCQ